MNPLLLLLLLQPAAPGSALQAPVAATSEIQDQEAGTLQSFWAQAGVGAGPMEGEGRAFSALLGVSQVMPRERFRGVRYLTAAPLCIFDCVPETRARVRALGLVMGREVGGGPAAGLFAVGAGVVWGREAGGPATLGGASTDFATVGVLLEAHLGFREDRSGSGLTGFVNLNPGVSTVGIHLDLHLGAPGGTVSGPR